ncbi:M23 family metallopeptidase [Ichthyenterobacterium sp. W332]|uniref:M23 family metallopeptidase n=1 Tax=Microcosmobacter mediterraneus TaxID=3075607 RepID=A0ABU2YGQ9_9FLAO|nr:M23 family metallopeptidase [Ichthyenterobacterium sp. W332]MDT0557066.1 M23 family metallopeptidase [Ichthyenterobacterium sp. W332]
MLKIKLLLICLFSCIGVYAQKIKQFKTVKDDTLYVSYINPFKAPIEIKMSIKDSMKGKIKAKSYGLMYPNDTIFNVMCIPMKIVKDTAKIEGKKYINFSGQYGDPKSKPNLKYRYTLPWTKGKKYKIIQGFNGRFSHSAKHSKYAYDFSTQIGDTIVAARNGVVIFTKDDSKERGGREAMSKANKIIVYHDDGTFGHYVHLDYKGVLIKVGDSIKAQQAIGISGFTGFTTTPHLHFVVMKYGSEAIPIYFIDYPKKPLRQGKYYRRKL